MNFPTVAESHCLIYFIDIEAATEIQHLQKINCLPIAVYEMVSHNSLLVIKWVSFLPFGYEILRTP